MGQDTPITLNRAENRFELHADGHMAWLAFAPVPGALAFALAGGRPAL